MMLEGKSSTQIKKWFKENYPDMTEHTMEKDITLCYRELDKYVEKDINRIIEQHLLLYDDIISKNSEYGITDYVLKAMSQKEKLFGILKPETQVNVQVNNNSNTFNLDHISEEKLAETIKKLTQ